MNIEVDSVRDDLVKAFDAVEGATPEPAPAPEPKDPIEEPKDDEGRARDANGKFQKKEEKSEPVKAPPPKSWKAEDHPVWEEMSPKARAAIERREAEVEKGFTHLDEDRNFGKQLKEIVTPYMPMINADGGTPVTAIQSLLNTAYQLRAGTPQSRGQLIMELAKQFNAELPSNTAAVQSDPLAQTQAEIARLRQQIEQQPAVLKQQQEDLVLQSHIDVFAADPKNVHFAKLKPVMASLLHGGQAKSLQDAYDQAQWIDPEIRSATLAASEADKEAKRIADIKAKADKARSAAVSVRGSPNIQVMNGSSSGSVRDDLLAAFEEHAA